MTFSTQIKEELTKIVIKDDDNKLAELAGFLISNCEVQREDKEYILKMCSENEFAIRRMYTILKSVYGIVGKSNVERPKIPGAEPLYHLKIISKTDLKTLFSESFITINEKLQIVLQDRDIVLKSRRMSKKFFKRSFLR